MGKVKPQTRTLQKRSNVMALEISQATYCAQTIAVSGFGNFVIPLTRYQEFNKASYRDGRRTDHPIIFNKYLLQPIQISRSNYKRDMTKVLSCVVGKCP